MRLGAIVLCGGSSTRMGMPKADLLFGDETMLARVVRRLSEVASPIVVVTAHGQTPPTLATPCRFAADARPNRGPLEGLAAGLRAIAADADAVYATSCDAPLLVPAFVQALADRLAVADAAVPCDGQFAHPLSAVYRTGVLAAVNRMLAAGRLRTTDLLDEIAARRISVDELRAADPRLDSLRNLNRPEDYLAALAESGFTPPPELLMNLRRAASST
ncbi:MAG: molybdopterin-guanine dinucleotide biosynthesis protein A [Planctomycetota bacterium]|nr:MAG: molybdopterin-guanine dinucleotide biosynthesis protein A [Planctomycetota bacterium]